MNNADYIVARNLAYAVAIVVLLWGLSVILCREWVKNDLRRNLCQPIQVRWRFFASTRITCAFRVVYSDLHGQLHRARCRTFWLKPDVTWEDDIIIGQDNSRRVV